MHRFYPSPKTIVNSQTVSSLYDWPEKVWVKANMVQSLDATVIDSMGTTDDLTNETDKLIFRTLRQLSDVILIGAKTALKNKYEDIKINSTNTLIRKKLKLNPKPRLAIITNRLNLDRNFLKNWKDKEKPIIYTPKVNENVAKDLINLSEIVFCGQTQVNLKYVKKDLIQRSFKRILCEGGPTLLNSMFQNNLIDELDLTLQVKLTNSSNPLKLAQGPLLKPAVKLKPIQVIQHEKTLLLRYLVHGHRL